MKSTCLVGAALAVALVAGTASGQFIGPSTTFTPHVLPSGPQAGLVSTTSILTAGDSIGGYKLVGIPDGMGGFGNGDGTFTMFVNHELAGSVGAVRAHGQTGAFVSRWNINVSNLAVNSGRDHNTSSADAYEYYPSTGTWSNAPDPSQRWNRFCSADLPAPSAFRFGNLGTDARLFMNGEETGNEGRAYAHIVTGPNTNQTWQLPHLGKFSWENSVASPFAQQKTVVVGLDDSSPGQVYVYVGNKTASGNEIERAGLTNGGLYGVTVNGLPTELRASPASGAFTMTAFNNVANTTGATLQASSNTAGVTNFLRPEDGAWDPRNPNDFYFVTTDRFNTPASEGRSRLYRMRFNDIANPEAGGTVTALLDGTEGQQMFDNLCIDSYGRILIQEDPGGQDYLSKIWLYDIDTAGFLEIGQYDTQFFTPGQPGFLTNNEESSGIFDARDILGDGWFLMNSQAHYGIPGEVVEGGQLIAMYVDPRVVPAPGVLALLGLGGLVGGRRRR